ncbi:hypothetical protein [Actinotalea sp.]|uniref:DUF6912 family protein n=1 Tax=Actinotalea sp. TaxID=1872145 RepID=UPI002C5930FE|nr:hypothetical protein [Actinotalea sp.]HQY34061.1 hypothetical protein [Actinotalea sp.]HRA49984.1 hypothetical protein [Actinotalea sp.]
MRIYLPSTVTELGATAGLPPRLVHAVTPALRAALPDEDDEGLEYAAQLFAADDSLDHLEPARTGARRVVVAADVPEAVVDAVEDGEAYVPSLVRLTTTVGWDDVACAHVDEKAAEADVVAAVAGDEAAGERLADRDLLWYDVSELPRLATTAGPRPR